MMSQYSKYYNPEKKRAYYLKHREKFIRRAVDYNKNNKDRRNKLTRERREKARLARTKECPICKNIRPLTWDHCHVTGKERGWICSQCNVILGMAQDNVKTLENAIEYLKERDYARRHDVSI